MKKATFTKPETLQFIHNAKEYTGTVLEEQNEYIWFSVPELGYVYMGHPDRVFEVDGVKYFSIWDRRCSIEDIALDRNRDIGDFLLGAKEKEHIIKIIKMEHLLFQ